MRTLACYFALLVISGHVAFATDVSRLQGIVHDPQHRPVSGAHVALHAAHSDLYLHAITNRDGAFAFAAVALGEYTIAVSGPGFNKLTQPLTLASNTSPILHFELQVGMVEQTVAVQGATSGLDTVTPSILIGREDIAQTPGADRTNSMAMITDYVPGAYMTHDMLHMRGGHQVSWLIDGVQIPNTNIASNVGAQIDPKDIDYIEVQRGSYTADTGDRTYGVVNVVPRTGFERNRQSELVLSAGSFLQTSDQINFGDHSEKLAYYASLNGNRSDYGLSPPVGRTFHDAANGYGGFASFIYNRTPQDQFRLVTQLRNDYFQIPYDPEQNDFENQKFDSSGLRDGQHEGDGVVALSWLRTFKTATVLQISPFYHYNNADYGSNPKDTPVATTTDRTSNYAGAQASISAQFARNTFQGGIYSFGQHDSYLFGAIFNDGSNSTPVHLSLSASGGVMEEFISDNYQAASWLTFIAGLRLTQFQGKFLEEATTPRFGVAVRVPRLNWVLRGFYGRFYQPPPLLTASGPLVQIANANNTDFAPLRGERDEEHQFGVQIPYRGWLLDVDSFKSRVNNFLDHSNIGDSSIYFPVTVDGALVRAWELTLQSPRLWSFGQAHLAYSNQIAEQRGAVTGGLVCYPITSPQCDASPGYRPVDHDQRNTLNIGFNASLPWRVNASTNIYYGSGFTNGAPDPTTPYPGNYLPQHANLDYSLGKRFGENITASVTALNLADSRVLLDNSLTFGGFHYNNPREIYGEVRYRFKY